jgi:predicted nucleotidyltransferase component of viral defense system
MKISELYRTATEEEKRNYKEILYPLQDRILEICSHNPDLYLTGGTALSRFYLEHRLSDDIDLFIFIKKSDDLSIINNIKHAGIIARDLKGQFDKFYEVKDELYGEYYSRLVIKNEFTEVKIDFVREYNHFGEFGRTDSGILLNNLEDMCGNKISAFEERAEIKDIIDLYYLSKRFPIERMFEIANLKREPVQYENLLTINLFGIKGRALMLDELNPNDLESFIDELKETTETEIKKKEELVMNEIGMHVRSYLWDFPPEDRNINRFSKPVLANRLKKMPLPVRRAIKRVIEL